MRSIVFPTGETLSSIFGEFPKGDAFAQIRHMQIVEETRRQRLNMLIKQHGGVSALVAAIAVPKITNSALSRIANANKRHERGTTYDMGPDMARSIETALTLETGWMDTPPTYTEIHGEDDPRTKVMALMEALPPDQWATAVRLLDALAQPAPGNGTTGTSTH